MTIEIIRERCTNCSGCELCIEFCPQKNFVLIQGKIQVVNPDLCTKCKMCEMSCPSFAICVK